MIKKVLINGMVIMVLMATILSTGKEYARAENNTTEEGQTVDNPWSGMFEDDTATTSKKNEMGTTSGKNGGTASGKNGGTASGTNNGTTDRQGNSTADQNKTAGQIAEFCATNRVKISRAARKKKTAKKVRITLKKKLGAADGYEVRFFKKKADAKKMKNAVVKILTKKNRKTFTVSNKKLEKTKNLFVMVRAYKNIQGKVYYAKAWSLIKKVKTMR